MSKTNLGAVLPGTCPPCNRVLLDFLVTVKAVPHECVVRAGQP